jgi:VWFA-related protein
MRTLLRSAILVGALLPAVAGARPFAPQQTQPPPASPPAAEPPPASAQPPGQQPPRPTIRTGINFVRVDVIVTDRQGNPVLDLTQDDFALAEDGKAQRIESFSMVKVDEASQVETGPLSAIRSMYDEEREAARPDARLFVILLDDYHVNRGNDMAVRKPLTEFIQNQLAPADMVAIMYPLTPVDDIRFSRDRDAQISAIERFEGRKFNYTPRNAFEEQYAQYPAQTVERIRNQVTMSALKAAAIRLGGLRDGRKSIIFVSEGLTALLPPQMSDPIASMPGYANPNRRNPMATTTDRQEFMAQVDLLTDMREVFAVLNRQNTSIYAVDPRGLAAFGFDIKENVNIQTDQQHLRASLDTLRTLADNTDGRAIINRNDLAVGMKQIIRDSSAYYLLGYTSSQAPTDGKFHEIKVNVRRRGVDVRSRKGYWALTAEDVARVKTAAARPGPPPAITSALSDLVEPPRGRPARFWIGTARGSAGKTRVTFVWEPVSPLPGERQELTAARVALTAVTADGRPAFRGRVPDAQAAAPGGPAAPAAATAGTTPPTPAAGGSATFEVPPGPLDLRMSVEGARGEVIDSSAQQLNVPDFTAVQVSLGTPRLYRARTVREMQALKTRADAMPTTDREFSRSERMLLRVDAYGPGGVAPAVTARLLNRAGLLMSELPLQVGGTGVADMEMPLSALAAGEYLIEVNARTPDGSAQEIVAFKVGR